MVVFKREMQANYKGLLVWSAVMSLTVVLLLGLYPQFASDQADLDAMLAAFPESMLKAFNMDKVYYGTLIGYYSVQGFLMITLFGSVYAAQLGSHALAKEEEDKTIEFLLARPITRKRLVGEKYLGVGMTLALFDLFVGALTVLSFIYVEEGSIPWRELLLLAFAAPLLLHYTFAAAAFLMGTALGRSRTAFSITLGLIFGTYFLQILVNLFDNLAFLRFFSPFVYVDTAEIVLHGRIPALFVMIMVFIVAGCGLLASRLYARRDIFS